MPALWSTIAAASSSSSSSSATIPSYSSVAPRPSAVSAASYSSSSSSSSRPSVSTAGDAVSLDFSHLEISSASVDEVSKASLPVRPYVFIAIDLEATTGAWEFFSPGRPFTPGTGKMYPAQTPTQIGISILRATGKNGELFANDPKSKSGTEFRHIQIKEFSRYKTRVRKLRTAKPVNFLYGKTEYIPLAKINEMMKNLIKEESRHGEVILLGHAIQNDEKFLHNGDIRAFDNLFPYALDTQVMHMDPEENNGQGRSLVNLVHSYDVNLGDGWHNAGNDAMWTLWIFAKKVQDILTVSESGEEMVLDYSKAAKPASRKQRRPMTHHTPESLYRLQEAMHKNMEW